MPSTHPSLHERQTKASTKFQQNPLNGENISRRNWKINENFANKSVKNFFTIEASIRLIPNQGASGMSAMRACKAPAETSDLEITR